MWRRRRRNLRVRKYTIVSARVSLCAGLCASAALCAAASDEHALRQALTIVQLLRAEFGRLDPRLTDTPALTCAPTPAIRSSQTEPSRRYWTQWNKKAQPLRRMDYEDAFGAHPSTNDNPKPVTSASSTSYPESTTGFSKNDVSQDVTTVTAPSSTTVEPTTHSTAPTNLAPPLAPTTLPSTTTGSSVPPTPSISTLQSDAKHISTYATTPFKALTTKSSLKTMPTTFLESSTKHLSVHSVFSSPSVTKFKSEKPAPHTKKTATGTLKKLGLNKHASMDTAAPELEQVALELAGELKSSRPWPRRSIRPKPRATWREHLARSTRYAVPLPENHAFCYTDPNNALCRTLI